MQAELGQAWHQFISKLLAFIPVNGFFCLKDLDRVRMRINLHLISTWKIPGSNLSLLSWSSGITASIFGIKTSSEMSVRGPTALPRWHRQHPPEGTHLCTWLSGITFIAHVTQGRSVQGGQDPVAKRSLVTAPPSPDWAPLLLPARAAGVPSSSSKLPFSFVRALLLLLTGMTLKRNQIQQMSKNISHWLKWRGSVTSSQKLFLLLVTGLHWWERFL